MIVAAAGPHAKPTSRQSYVWFSDDGSDWTEPVPIGEPDFWMWGIEWHEGAAYGVSFDYPSKLTHTRLQTSKDGVEFETLVAQLNPQPDTNEAAIIFRDDGTAVALVRRDTAGALIGTSSGDFTKWEWKDTEVRIGGPALIELPDGRILGGGRLYDGGHRTSLFWVDADKGKLTECLRLPSGGDTSYPGFILHAGVLYVSYYSSHDGKTSIYLAKVKIRDMPDDK
jgi:hypothetical protein